MNAQAIVGLALKASIMMTVFAFGLESGTEDLLYLLRRPRLLIRSLTAMFVVMPLFVLLMTKVVSFNPVVVIALIALSISPVPPLLPKKVNKSGGLAPYGIGLMVTAATLSIGYIPLATYLLGKYFNRPLSMDPGAVAKLVVSSVLIPLAVGIVFRRLAPTTAKRIANPMTRVAGIVLVIGVLCILAFALPSVLALIGDGTILAFIAFVIAGIVVGHLLGGPGPDERVTLALCAACRHPGLALAIAKENNPAEHRVVSAVLVYLVINALITLPYVAWSGKKIQRA